MPKATFNKLSAARKNAFTEAFLKEFAMHDFDNASISKVLKNLSIAKGSFYQYFEDKMDLFNYLIAHCGAIKMGYIKEINRKQFVSFWDYWFALIQAGLRYDQEHPIETNFMYNLSKHMDAPSLKEFKAIYTSQSQLALEQIIEPEIVSGQIRNDLPLNVIAYFIKNTNIQMLEYIKSTLNDELVDNIKMGKPLFGNNHSKEIENIARIYIKLMQAALSNQQKNKI